MLVRGQLWLLDFARAGTGGHASPFADAARMIACLLFEHYPVPLSLDEVKSTSISRLAEMLEAPHAPAARHA